MKKDIPAEQVNPDQISTSLAIPQDPLAELQGQTAIHEQGLISIAPNKGATSFNSGAYGTGTIDGPLKAVILDVDIRRTLWPFGSPEVVKEILDWSGKRPICGSRNVWNSDGTVTPGAIKGSLARELDEEAKEQVQNLIIPIQEARFRCRPKGLRGTNGYCPWAEYGTAFSGGGQACRETRLLLLYLVDENLVCTLSVNPTSLNNWSEYDITFQQKHWSTIVTQIDSVPMDKDNQIWNILKFSPYKENKQILNTTKEMLSPIFVETMHNGVPMRASKACIQQFREVGFEIPEFAEGDAEF